MKIKKCIPAMALTLIDLVSYLKFLFKEAFTHLGLLMPPPQEDYSSPNHLSGDILVTNSRYRSLVLVPLPVVTEMIKKKLQVIEYGNFVERFGDEQQMESNTVCTVCLEDMERSDEIRELCNCFHVFHKECLDTWVNEGQVTCPLCRSTLYPDSMDWTNRFMDH